MTSRSAYFKEYNLKLERKEYLRQKSKARYYKNKKGVGNLVCPNCQTVQEFNLVIKKNNTNDNNKSLPDNIL